MFKFRNIDSFKPGKFERIGMLKGKRWYLNNYEDKIKTGLFKPQRYEFKDRKVFCANHYGEFVAYLLAKNSSTKSCPVELAKLSRYYSNIHKERNAGTPEEKDGCIIYSVLEQDDILEAGRVTTDMFANRHPEQFRELNKSNSNSFVSEDNIELFLKSVESRTRDFYKDYCTRDTKFLPKKYERFVHSELSDEYIEEKVNQNRKQAINMIIFDCLYGNNDRHNENWSMVTKFASDRIDIELYSLYDNERVLGLYENQNTIQKALDEDNIEEVSDEILFSRMRVPGEKKQRSTYKDIINYMMANYPEDTKPILEYHLNENTPEKVKEILESCENLPRAYIDFGSKMYNSRYKFAREILDRNKINTYNFNFRPSIRVELPRYDKTGYTGETR